MYTDIIYSNSNTYYKIHLMLEANNRKKVDENLHDFVKLVIDGKLRRKVVLRTPRRLFREDFFLQESNRK